MKSYTITVNGTVYDVTVEEKAGGAAAPRWVKSHTFSLPATDRFTDGRKSRVRRK